MIFQHQRTRSGQHTLPIFIRSRKKRILGSSSFTQRSREKIFNRTHIRRTQCEFIFTVFSMVNRMPFGDTQKNIQSGHTHSRITFHLSDKRRLRLISIHMLPENGNSILLVSTLRQDRQEMLNNSNTSGHIINTIPLSYIRCNRYSLINSQTTLNQTITSCLIKGASMNKIRTGSLAYSPNQIKSFCTYSNH